MSERLGSPLRSAAADGSVIVTQRGAGDFHVGELEAAEVTGSEEFAQGQSRGGCFEPARSPRIVIDNQCNNRIFSPDNAAGAHDRAEAAISGTAGLKRHAMTNADESELVHTRVMHASREQVFRAFRDPHHLAVWWGPTGFRSTIHEFDFRAGGRWDLTLHGPDGADYRNEYFALEIIEPERIVISHPDPAHTFQLIVTLSEAGENKTQLTWRQVFSSREHFEQIRSFVAEANEQVLDRLEAEAGKILPARAS